MSTDLQFPILTTSWHLQWNATGIPLTFCEIDFLSNIVSNFELFDETDPLPLHSLVADLKFYTLRSFYTQQFIYLAKKQAQFACLWLKPGIDLEFPKLTTRWQPHNGTVHFNSNGANWLLCCAFDLKSRSTWRLCVPSLPSHKSELGSMAAVGCRLNALHTLSWSPFKAPFAFSPLHLVLRAMGVMNLVMSPL